VYALANSLYSSRFDIDLKSPGGRDEGQFFVSAALALRVRIADDSQNAETQEESVRW
jgi:hypothetical protein